MERAVHLFTPHISLISFTLQCYLIIIFLLLNIASLRDPHLLVLLRLFDVRPAATLIAPVNQQFPCIGKAFLQSL